MIIGSIPGAKSNAKQVKNKDAVGQEEKQLEEFDPKDHRLFIGNIDRKVTETQLQQAFSHYTSLLKVRIITDKRTGQSKGYGFVSLRELEDSRKALREMQAKYVGAKPIKVVKSKAKKNLVISNLNHNESESEKK